MKLRFGLLFVLLILNFASAVESVAQSSVRSDVLEMSEHAERRIRQSVVDLLGPESRAVVNVHIRESRGVPQLSVEEVVGDIDGLWLLTGNYLPPTPKPASQNDPQSRASIFVNSAEVSIRVEKFVSDAQKAEIKEIAQSVLRGIETQVEVNATLEETQVLAQARAQSDRSPASIEAGSESEKSALDYVLSRYSGLVPIVAALFLLLGFMLMGRAVKTSARELSEGLRAIKPQGAMSGPQTLTLNAPAKELSGPHENENSMPRLAPPHLPVSGVELKRNLSAIEVYIFENPMLFTRAFSDDAEDLLGLKFLVAKISPEAKTKLRELLGLERIIKATSFQLEQSIVGFDAKGWLQRLIERIELKKLAGGNVVEEALTSEESLILASASSDKIFSVAQKINSPECWRVATDFLPSDYIKRQSAAIDPQTWKLLVKASLINETDAVKSAARALIDSVGIEASENAVLSKSRRDSEEHFSKKILPPLVDCVLGMDLGEDDEFLHDIVSDSPEFTKPLFEAIWTPNKLDLFDDEVLREVFNRLDNERKSYLICVLPTKHAERLQSFLPEGNARKIVLDYVSKLKNASDKTKSDAMKALAREFLDYLRAQSLSGKLALREGALASFATPLSSRSGSVAEVVEDADFEDSSRKAS